MNDPEGEDGRTPWPQRFYESVWLWAGIAVLFWILSYVVWAAVDLMLIPGG